MSEPVEQNNPPRRDTDLFELFEAASNLPAEERVRFLDDRCANDLSLRGRIERLLAFHDHAGLLDESLSGRLGLAGLEPFRPLAAGTVVGARFRIVRTIGMGGMGTVYEAEDLDGGTNVALKTVRTGGSFDGELTKRLRRELRLARDVSHPNVCRVFDYWDVDGPSGQARITFFTMELLQGETLAQRLERRGKIAPKEAVQILRQVASGLDEIHRAGIVHRDLKPSNIFLVGPESSGKLDRVVVMDFGIARGLDAGVESQVTTTGVMIGTPRYMSPEQTKGDRVDRSTDIYSFGVVALEMVTGANHPLVAPSSAVKGLSGSWDDAILSCFLPAAKRPKSAGAVVSAIERTRVPWTGMALVLGALVVVAFAFWQVSNSDAAARYGHEGATQLTFDSGFTADPATTADGKMLVYASDRGSQAGDLNIWSHNLESGEMKQLTNHAGDEDEPAISPDGKVLAYRLGSNNTLYLKNLPDGVARPIGNWIVAPRFSPDGSLLAYWSGHSSTPGQLWLLPLKDGATPRRIAADFVDARFPAWAPDSQSLLFRGAKSAVPNLQANREWWITDREGKSYRTTGAAQKLGKSGVVPHDSPVAWDGKFVVFSAANGDSRNLWRLSLFGPFGFLISGPEVITTGSGFQAVPAILADGRVAYADWRRQTHIWRIDSSGTGKSVQVTAKTSEDAGVSASTDGRRIVFVRIRGKSRDVWLKDMQSGIERELLPGEPAIPLLAPGGEQVAISIGKQILLLDVASGRRTTLLENAGEILAWTPDGTALLYVDVRDTHRHAIVRVNIYSKKRQILLEGGGLHHAAYSPDGKSLAASVRDDSSHSRIVLADVKSDGSVGEWNSITDNGYWAERPVWSANGRVVYFVTDKDGFWCVFGQEVNAASLEVIGAPAALTHLHAATSSLSHLVDATSGMARIGKDILLCIGSEHSNIWAVRP